jgi:hypothetical protein
MASLLYLAPVVLLLLPWVVSLLPGRRAKGLPPGNEMCQATIGREQRLIVSRTAHLAHCRKSPHDTASPPRSQVCCVRDEDRLLTYLPRLLTLQRFTQLAKIYGSIFSLKIGSGTIVVFSTAKPAIEVMDKHSLLSSNRPPSYILAQRVFRGNHPMYMAPADRWKVRRKLYHQVLQESVVNKVHVPLVEAESLQLVRDICSKPEDLMLHPGRYSNSVTMCLGKRKKIIVMMV